MPFDLIDMTVQIYIFVCHCLKFENFKSPKNDFGG